MKRIVHKIEQLGIRIVKIFFRIIRNIIVKIARVFPLKNRIIVEPFLGRRHDDNITELIKSYTGIYPIYYVQRKHETLGLPVEYLHKNSLRYLLYMNTSKYIITNSRLHASISKKRFGQVIVQMWHGVPWKKLAFDQREIFFGSQTHEEYLYNFKQDVNKWDYLWVPNAYAKEKLLSAFRYEGKLIKQAYPADVAMLKRAGNPKIQEELKAKLGIPQQHQVVLYMPTFRENTQIATGVYDDVTTFNVVDFVKQHEDVTVLTRAHYLVDRTPIDTNQIIDVSLYTSLIDLYLVADVLITDYSSAIYPFAQLEKPIISIQYDYEAYQNMRDFYPNGIEGMQIIEVRTADAFQAVDMKMLQKSTPIFTSYGFNRSEIWDSILNDSQ